MEAASNSRIHQVNAFLERYRALKQSHTGDINPRIETLLSELQQINSTRKAVEATEAPEFNVIKLLGVERDERAHSRVMAGLLSPRGSHGQKGLFLFKFLDRCLPQHQSLRVSDQVLPRFRVVPEKVTWFGRIDIMIRLPKSFCIAIENKVDAVEGHEQLHRYSEWLARQPEPCKALFFLTPDGRRSEQNIEATRYVRLSYRDIAEWLDECLPSLRPLALRSFLMQYINAARAIALTMEGYQQDGESE